MIQYYQLKLIWNIFSGKMYITEYFFTSCIFITVLGQSTFKEVQIIPQIPIKMFFMVMQNLTLNPIKLNILMI